MAGTEQKPTEREHPSPQVEASRGRVIETLCIACGWEKKSLARKVGVSDGTVSRWKEGKGPTPRNLSKLLEALGLPPEAMEVTVAYLRSLRRLQHPRHGDDELYPQWDGSDLIAEAAAAIDPELRRRLERLTAELGSDVSRAVHKLLVGFLRSALAPPTDPQP